MSKREWTMEELDLVWPIKAHGFRWHKELGGWQAVAINAVDDTRCWVSALFGDLRANDGVPPEVALAVASVALGFESRETIAEAINARRERHSERSGDIARGAERIADLAKAIEAHDCAEMVRRGTVLP